MKKIMCLILTVLMAFSLSISTTYAANVPMKEVIEKFDGNVEEKNVVKDSLLKSGMQPLKYLIKFKKDFKVIQNTDVSSEEDLILGQPYKVVDFPSPTLDNNRACFEGFINGEKVIDILQNAPYYYEVPVLTKKNNTPVSSVQLKKENGVWEVTLYPCYMDPEISYIVSQPEKVVELLKSLGIETVDKYMLVNLNRGYDFLYTLSDNKEYFIPLEKGFGTELLKVYTRDQFQAIFAPLMEKVLRGEELPTGGGVANVSKNDNKTVNIKNNNEIIYIALSFGVIVAVSLIYIVRNKIKHKTL
ncbi:hypothetical protein SAMN02746089_01078 [Caldanaerobius fijiensis DSM 17918]|uniref:Uncharacterized protein n=1 Tax=Caldanaerobius fijiensis DSM 17918 TaxID=1121256 RepID=A0A1M4XQX2_9THEO|nr:hypothetical protein [Caldanaerobius fijiensis]SHE95766.1 hypothetical protein SAMN02746089_01078 [Caldanaerobius fijiensis DSM 17918]